MSLPADIQNMTGFQVEDKAFLAFERRSSQQGVSGVYFWEFDKKNGSAIQNPDTVITTAPKVIDSSVYNNANIDRILLYSNKPGTDVTITLVTRPVGGITFVHTGRIVGGGYVPCSAPAQVQGNLKSFFSLYYGDNTKNKFMLFDNGTILPEAH
jgi:hypothetical protein